MRTRRSFRAGPALDRRSDVEGRVRAVGNVDDRFDGRFGVGLEQRLRLLPSSSNRVRKTPVSLVSTTERTWSSAVAARARSIPRLAPDRAPSLPSVGTRTRSIACRWVIGQFETTTSQRIKGPARSAPSRPSADSRPDRRTDRIGCTTGPACLCSSPTASIAWCPRSTGRITSVPLVVPSQPIH